MPSALISHREKVLAHAERQLAMRGKNTPAELLPLYKKFLKIENHRLRLRHNAGGGGRQNCEQRASLLDIVLRHLFDGACATGQVDPEKQGLSLVAVGGYGRGELNPFSDVDIMFLHDAKMKTLPSAVNQVIEAVLYMLWDVGFKVGHSTRTVPGAIKHANEDMLSKTSLLESRYITGSKKLFDQFKVEFQKKCVAGYVNEYIEDRVKNQAERHSKFGDTVYLQEPNIKNGCGGLRDYQNLLWISHFKAGVMTTAGLQEKKLLSETERRKLDSAYDFLLRVRTELHFMNKRSTDVLALNQQFQIANKFEYPEKNVLRRAEAFMRDYYQHARNIFFITELLADRLSLQIDTKTSIFGKLLNSRSASKVQETFDGFILRDGRIYPESRDVFQKDPHRLMLVFQYAQRRHVRFSAELAQLIGRRLQLVDRTFQYSRANRETFSAILSRKGEVGEALRMMHEVEFLGRYIPEFGDLTCLVQHEFFHRYTADEHTLVCIEKLDAIIDTENPKLAKYREIFQKLEDPVVLYLALLLHDTGKAANVRYHSEASAVFAQRVAARLQLSSERRQRLIFLVDHHMTLSATAQRRNLDDSATIEEFAGIVRSQGNLDALMLLTLADGQGTGDENWSDWKESLVWELYHSTSQYLADSDAFFRQRKLEREGLQEAVLKKLPKEFKDEVDAHFALMPDSYFLGHEPQEIVSHVRLFHRFLEARHKDPAMALAPALRWVPHPDQGNSEVRLVTWDRKELLARIAGCFAVRQLNILSADIFTRSDSLVLDIFRVCDTKFQAVTDEREISEVEKQMHVALEQEDYDFRPLLERLLKRRSYHLSQELDFPTKISIDNDSHPRFTLIDIITPDRLGLLYNLLRGMASVDVNIVLSRIATEKGAAIDSFYVTDQKGRKITGDAQVRAIQDALRAAAEAVMVPA